MDTAQLVRFTKTLLEHSDTRVKRLAVADALHRAAPLDPIARAVAESPEMRMIFAEIYGAAATTQLDRKKGMATW